MPDPTDPTEVVIHDGESMIQIEMGENFVAIVFPCSSIAEAQVLFDKFNVYIAHRQLKLEFRRPSREMN